MKEGTLSIPSSSSSQCSQNSDVEEYQVDSISASSCKDGQDPYDIETDGAIVIAEEPKLPSFGSVSVVNSNDVHFGNKTVYQGPVTIKQFVYPNSGVPSECINGLEDTVKKVNTDLDPPPPPADGVDNPAFVKDSCSAKDGDDKTVLPNNNAQHTLPGIRKGILWLQNVRKRHTRDIVIIILVIIVSITILMTIMYWKHPSNEMESFPIGDTDEQENNTPVDYSPDSNTAINKRLRMFSRLQWLARPPVEKPNPLKTPVPLVIIQHTATEPCVSVAQCIFQTKTIQLYHIESNHWWDIGYNFLVGGDGAVYEGRGWTSEGAHTLGYNNRSIGVGFIGTFTSHVPPKNQIVAFKKLIEKGVDSGYIQKDYKLLAARQLYGTESPGIAFFQEIKTWPHWSKEP